MSTIQRLLDDTTRYLYPSPPTHFKRRCRTVQYLLYSYLGRPHPHRPRERLEMGLPASTADWVLEGQLPSGGDPDSPMKISPGTAIGVAQLQITSRPPRLIYNP